MSSEETDNPHSVFVPPILALPEHSYSLSLTFTTLDQCWTSTSVMESVRGEGPMGSDVIRR
jgi:hypothetical protein